MPQPYIKFYLRDWEGDRELMACSLAARGLLVHIMRTMQDAEPYGFFVGRNGEPIDLSRFAEDVRATPREVRKLIAELEHNGALSRDSFDRLFSRRMTREAIRREQASFNGSMGGSPLLKAMLNQELKPMDKLLDKHSDKVRDKTHGNNHSQNISTDSLRSSAEWFGEFPADIEGLRRLAALFVGAFANCRDEAKAEKHIGPYAQVLAQMRSRGVSIVEAWAACSDALENNGRPLFGASIKGAMAFLAPPGTRPRVQHLRAAPADDAFVAQLRRESSAG